MNETEFENHTSQLRSSLESYKVRYWSGHFRYDQRYRILIDRGRIAELIESIYQETVQNAEHCKATGDALQNLCVLVWSACERHCRGELLSARQYLDGFAVNQLLSLIVGTRHDGSTLDWRNH
ncbi:MAG TPA: hypothetical protein VGQ39_06350 [Pyrinomonadaceae bacterium]|jgi:hypothetical protein|nr:hypothetical protein [Pyrinomonadaceae bacterium]